MTNGEIRRLANAEALANAAAELFVQQAAEAQKTYGRFSVALSGGSTPKAMHQLLAGEFADRVDWSRVHVFFGDERTVPPDHDDSNYRMAKETLLDKVAIPAGNIHRMQGELEPASAAEGYEKTLRAFFSAVEWPQFDLVFLGMGGDGHTASLFPGTGALKSTDRWVLANHVQKLDTWRITLTAPAINAARTITFLIAGENKADTLREVVNGPYLPETYPSQLIEPTSGELLWLVDEATASLL